MFQWNGVHSAFYLVTADGEFRIEHLRTTWRGKRGAVGLTHDTDKADGSGAFPDRLPGEVLHFRRGAFAYVTGERWGDYHHAAFFPAWCLGVVASIAPVAFPIELATRGRRRRPGCCPSCGYDL